MFVFGIAAERLNLFRVSRLGLEIYLVQGLTTRPRLLNRRIFSKPYDQNSKNVTLFVFRVSGFFSQFFGEKNCCFSPHTYIYTPLCITPLRSAAPCGRRRKGERETRRDERAARVWCSTNGFWSDACGVHFLLLLLKLFGFSSDNL